MTNIQIESAATEADLPLVRRQSQYQKPRRRIVRSSTNKVEKDKKSRMDLPVAQNPIGFNKYQMKGFAPTTKVFINQPNPRFNYKQKRPTTANVNLNFNSVKSEAVMARPTSSITYENQELADKKTTLSTNAKKH